MDQNPRVDQIARKGQITKMDQITKKWTKLQKNGSKIKIEKLMKI